METEIKTTIILKASNGMILTNGEAYGKTVALGATDRAENWREIPEEEYVATMKEQESEV